MRLRFLLGCLVACGPSPTATAPQGSTPQDTTPQAMTVTLAKSPASTAAAPPAPLARPVDSTGQRRPTGRLPPEVIQQIVRQSFGKFRLCYEHGLRRDANLKGRIAIRFVIERSGWVDEATNGGSDLPDAAVVDCVVKSFVGLSFPPPDGGIVTVVYPISFAPGG